MVIYVSIQSHQFIILLSFSEQQIFHIEKTINNPSLYIASISHFHKNERANTFSSWAMSKCTTETNLADVFKEKHILLNSGTLGC